MRAERFTTDNKELYSIAFSIRKVVFMEEQNTPLELEKEFEDEAIHYLVFNESGEAMATARWREVEAGIKLERFAVLKEHRKKGVANFILNHILNEPEIQGRYVYLHSQASASEFYRKNGFQVMGNVFMEADIEHYKMVLKK